MSEEVVAMTLSSDHSRTVSIDGMLMDSQTTATVMRETKNRPKVKELTLRNVTIDDVIAQAAEDLFSDETRQWSKVELIHCTGRGARIMSASLPRTQLFAFTGSVPLAHNPRYSIDLESMRALGHALTACNTFTSLSLRGTRLDRAGLVAFCSGLTESDSLRDLQVSNCALDVNDVTLLAEALQRNRRLCSLSVAHCKIGTSRTTEESTDHFCLLLESLVSHPTLEKLNLFGMHCTPRAMQTLADLLLSRNTRLHRLGLKDNLRHLDGKLHVTSLFEALETNKVLTNLQLSSNNLNDDDVERLARILSQSNRTLRVLSLTANNIDDDGIRSFARNLPKMKGLRSLDVQRNKFGDEPKKEIIAALKHNIELERLDLDGTWDATKSFYLRLNKGGRRLLQSVDTPLGLWPRVFERASRLPFGRNLPHAHLDVLYCLVKGPALFQSRRKRVRELSEETSDAEPQRKRVRREGKDST